MKRIILFTLAVLLGQAAAASSDVVIPNEASVIGTVDGKKITLGEIESKKIHDLRNDLYEELENAFISEAISRLKKSDEEFAKIKLPQVGEQEMRLFYDYNGLSQHGSYEQLAPEIKQYLQKRYLAKIEYRLYQVAVNKGRASSNMVDPGAYVVTVPVETAFVRGAKNGSVMLLEFSDFQCPYCKKVQIIIDRLIKKYGDKVAFGYRHFPLATHREADGSAIAVECAREQGKFIQMHERLYQQQSRQSAKDLQNLAKEIGVTDLKKFDACLQDDRYHKLLNHDIEVAGDAGITGTPSFIIGRYDHSKGVVTGELLTGTLPEDVFIKTLEKYLSETAKAD
jgi:protein-disulfide isomerase